MTRRRLLIIVFVFMLVVVAVLIGLFIILRASVAPAAVSGPGFQSIRSIYGWGSNPDQLLKEPFTVVWRNGSLYVTEKGNSDVVRLSQTGQLLGKYGVKGRGTGQVWAPTSVDVDAQGNVYIADGGHAKIVVYDQNGKFVREGQLKEAPLAILLDGNRMFATTAGSVKVLSLPDFKELASWGNSGRGVEQWSFPNGLAYDPATHTLYVGDGNNLRVKALDERGTVKWIYGEAPASMNDVSAGRKFGLVGGVELGNGYLFVTDPMDHVIHILDLQGKEVAQVGEPGSEDGQLGYPSTITHVGGKRYAIAEWGNQRVQLVDIDVPAAAKAWQTSQGVSTTTTVAP
jgi:DNA-binding beta-propeller fold protein YncE